MNSEHKRTKRFADSLALALIVIIALSAFNLADTLSSDNSEKKVEKLFTTTFVQSEITGLEIEVATAELNFVQGDTLSISNSSAFTVSNRNGKISIKEKGRLFSPTKSRCVTVTLPEGFTFKKVEIEVGASEVNGDILLCEKFECDIGAGFFRIDNLLASAKAEIDCAAGECIISNGSIGKLDFSLGVGKADIAAQLGSGSELECGFGELNLRLNGGKELYTIDTETGLGSFHVDSSKVSGETVIGSGENKISITSGAGSVSVDFTV